MASNDTEQTRLSELLGDLSKRDADLQPPARVQRAVMDRWAERQAGSTLPPGTVPPSAAEGHPAWTPGGLGLAGVAAAIVLAAWVLNRPVDSDIAQAAIPEVRVSPSFEVASPAPPAEVLTSSDPAITPEKAPGYARAQPGTSPVGSVAATIEPFVRLLPVSDQELAGIRLARVRLRGQAAQILGLELGMPPTGADGFIEADVLLGEDGLARAIRLVR